MAKAPEMSVANEVRVIAQELIREHHTHLHTAEMLYVFTKQRRKRCGRIRVGSAARMNAVQRFLASGLDSVERGPDFMILVDSNEWSNLKAGQRKALVDHELSHCALFVKDVEEEGPPKWRRFDAEFDAYDEAKYEYRWGLRGHDIEEFAGVLRRHGFWKADPQERQFEQIALQTVMQMAAKDGQPKWKEQPAPV